MKDKRILETGKRTSSGGQQIWRQEEGEDLATSPLTSPNSNKMQKPGIPGTQKLRHELEGRMKGNLVRRRRKGACMCTYRHKNGRDKFNNMMSLFNICLIFAHLISKIS